LSRTVRLLPAAEQDLLRLVDFLVDKNPAAAARAGSAIERGILSLSKFPERGHLVESAAFRELVIRFGHRAYIVQYRVEPDVVRVGRVFHSLEHR
jgi:plasmid stabilization system protein ParE